MCHRTVGRVRGAALSMCVAAAATASPAVQAQIYVGESPDSGAIVLSNFSGQDANVVLIAGSAAPRMTQPLLPAASSTARSRVVVPTELRRIVDAAAQRSSVSSQLIHAVIDAESHYVASAVSHRGAIGLMQLLPSTAKRFGANDPFDPVQNVAAGTAYLKWLMDFFGDDLELALSGYNAGEQAVVKAGRKVPPYNETRAYVKKVMAAMRHAESTDL